MGWERQQSLEQEEFEEGYNLWLDNLEKEDREDNFREYLDSLKKYRENKY